MSSSPSGRHPHPEVLYYAVAEDALHAAVKAEEEFARAQAIATVIVFSALCLEAYANQQLAGLDLEEAESLSLVSKWILLPRFRGGAGRFDEGAEPFQSFKYLIKLRNSRLVHFHPGRETEAHGTSKARPYLGELLQDSSTAQRCFDTIGAMIRMLEDLAPREGIPEFLQGSRYISRIWKSFVLHWETRSAENS